MAYKVKKLNTRVSKKVLKARARKFSAVKLFSGLDFATGRVIPASRAVKPRRRYISGGKWGERAGKHFVG